VNPGKAVLACERTEAVVSRRPAKTGSGPRDGARTGAAQLMSSATRTFDRPFRATILLVLAAAALFCVCAGSPAARAADPGALQHQISAGQSRVSALSGAVGADNGRLRELDASIADLRSKIARIQADLDAKRAELLHLRRELTAARARLVRLKAYERKAEHALSQELVANYETNPPNLVDVVLDSTGFSDLLERLSFARRIRTREQEILAAAIQARDHVAAQAVRLGALEGRQQDVTARVLAERDQVDAVRVTLLNRQISVIRARDKHVSQLTTARGHVASLLHRLAQLQAERARQAAQAAAARVSPSGGVPVNAAGGRAGSNPIPGFTIGRDDMGVDASSSPGAGIYAPLASTLVQVLSDWYETQPLLLFQFDNPPAGLASDYWYVAEQIDPVTTAIGTRFQAGQKVASFASSGTGIEIGWGSATSNARTLAGATDPAAASPPAGSATSWGESFKSAFGIP
jgi:peptidoglycan hydrolase CwlO-like protein